MSYVPFYSAHVQAATATTAQEMFAVEAHVQKTGWKNSTASSSTTGAIFAGSTGESHRLEAIKISLLSNAPKGLNISYRAHVQRTGWQDWVDEGEMAGTEHQSLRIEAIQLAVSGREAADYVVRYRAHVQKYGWLDWVVAGSETPSAEPKKGEFAGTTGEKKRIEAIEIVVLSKSDNDLLAVKEEAIRELQNKFNPANYTIDAENFNKAMEEAIADINSATSAAQVTGKLNWQIGTSIPGKVQTDEALRKIGEDTRKTVLENLTQKVAVLKVAITDGVKTTYADKEPLATAIKNAEATIKAAKVTTNEPAKDITTVAYAEYLKIYEATKTVVKDLTDEFYQNSMTTTKDDDKILTKTDYDAALTELEGKAPAGEDTLASEFKDVIDCYNDNVIDKATETLAIKRGYREIDVQTFLTNSGLGASNNIGGDANTSEKGATVGTRTTAQTKYADLVNTYVTSVKAGFVGKSLTQMEAAIATAKSQILSDIQTYIRNTLNRCTNTNYGVEAEKVVKPSDFDSETPLGKLLVSTNVEDLKALVETYDAFVAAHFGA